MADIEYRTAHTHPPVTHQRNHTLGNLMPLTGPWFRTQIRLKSKLDRQKQKLISIPHICGALHCFCSGVQIYLPWGNSPLLLFSALSKKIEYAAKRHVLHICEQVQRLSRNRILHCSCSSVQNQEKWSQRDPFVCTVYWFSAYIYRSQFTHPLNLCSKEFAIYLCATCIGFQRSIVPVGVEGVGPLLPLLPLY